MIAKKAVDEKPNMKKSILEQEVLDKRDIELFIRNFNEDKIDEKNVEYIANKIYMHNKWSIY